MKKEEISIFTYNEVLKNIENQENHLLIGNGFNYGLGINTSYKAIFQKMIEDNGEVYKDAIKMVKKCGYDLEKFIGKLEDDINSENIFLKKYVRNKIKFDFMRATHEIVKSEIKNIYAEKNEGIFILLKNFTNYFSLNYDTFLYLLLLKYKPNANDEKNTIVFQPSIKFIEDDLNNRQTNIYKEIKEAREKGILVLNFGNKNFLMEKSFNKLTKSHFFTEIKEYSKTTNKGWKIKDIDRVVKLIWAEEKRENLLNKFHDGFKQLDLFGEKNEFVYDVNSDTQNLFFLHGAFHIYKDGKYMKKITQKSDKALYSRLEEILNNDNQDIICVFQHDNKIEMINKNSYLRNCLKKLSEISGNLVIIGSSLEDNDNHIFEQIESSKIDNLYISTLLKRKEKIFELAKKKFPTKRIYLFDAGTISYELPEDYNGRNDG